MSTETRIESWTRPNVRAMAPYSSARSEHDTEGAILLDANENPFENGNNRYPDPFQKSLKRVISHLKGVNINHIFLGNGSDEPIDLLIRTFCIPGVSNIVITDPTYGMYKVSAALNDIEVRKSALNPDFSLNLENLKSATDQNSRILFLCTPNNPTANHLNRELIIECIKQFNGIVVVDEAYIDFSEVPSLTSEIGKYDNLVILQTLSKAWGLAGIRLGMCFAQEEIITLLNKVKPPYNIPGPSQEIAKKMLEEGKDLFKKNVSLILSERERLIDRIKGFDQTVLVYPSDANFILVRFKNAKGLYTYLKENGVMVRDRSRELHCEGCLRITIGTADENNRTLELIKKFNT